MPSESAGTWRRVATIATFVLVVAVLHFGKELLQPFAIAALLTFLLAPAVSLLRRLRMPRVMAVGTTVVVALGAVVALGITVVSQLDELRGSLTLYRDTISAKLSALGVAVSAFEQGFSDAVAQAPSALEPVAVRVVSSPSLFTVLGDVASPLIDPIANLAIVFVLVLFMLIYLDDMRDRIALILNVRNVTVTIQAVTEVSSRISRYLLMTLVINVSHGVPVAAGLALLGVPNAILWGVLAIFLRFIPYMGPWLAAAMPIALSFAISPGWGLTVAVIGLFLVLELVSNNLIEPWIYGSRTGLSPLAIIVAAIFWSWLWGMVGLLLSVPLTLILVVTGRYLRPLHFIYALFGDGPSLDPRARFYQRLVANDSDEAARIAEEFLVRRPLPELYDALMIPALRSLKFDEAAGSIVPVDAAVMRQSLLELAADLPAFAEKKARRRQKYERADQASLARSADTFARFDSAVLARVETGGAAQGAAEIATGADGDAKVPPAARVTFVPTGDESDALVGSMLAEVLRAEGTIVETVQPTLLAGELVRAGIHTHPDVVVVGGFLPANLVRVRHIVARLAAGLTPATPIVVGLWSAPSSAPEQEAVPRPRRRRRAPPTLGLLVDPPVVAPDPVAVEELTELGVGNVVRTLAEAAEAVRRLLAAR